MEIYVETKKDKELIESMFYTIERYMDKSLDDLNMSEEEQEMFDKLSTTQIVVTE